MIKWPAVLKYSGEDELVFIADETVWNGDSDLHFYGYSELDRLIDAEGNLYALQQVQKQKHVDILATASSLSLREFEFLVKAHLVALDQCCVEKIQLNSFSQGLDFVQQVQEN